MEYTALGMIILLSFEIGYAVHAIRFNRKIYKFIGKLDITDPDIGAKLETVRRLSEGL